jgi:hypothetical protein
MSIFSPFHEQPARHGANETQRPFLSPFTEYWDWGRIDLPDPVLTARTGIARYRLRVYPPGTTALERHELSVAKLWWLCSAAITVWAVLLVASAQLGTVAPGVTALAGFAVAWYWLARTRPIRHGTRALHVAVVMIGPREVFGDAALFGQCRSMLATADEAMRSGASTPVEREAIWAAVYDLLAPKESERVAGSGVSK